MVIGERLLEQDLRCHHQRSATLSQSKLIFIQAPSKAQIRNLYSKWAFRIRKANQLVSLQFLQVLFKREIDLIAFDFLAPNIHRQLLKMNQHISQLKIPMYYPLTLDQSHSPNQLLQYNPCLYLW